VFAERGYHGATMQAVAERAGVSKGSVYDYFDSKDELLLGAAETLVAALSEQNLRVLEHSSGPLRERIAAFVDSITAGLAEWTDVCFSLLQAWAELGPGHDHPLHELFARSYRASTDRIQAVFDESVARGEVEPFATRAAALALLAAIDGTLLQSIILPDEQRQAAGTGVFTSWCASIVPAPAPRRTKPEENTE